MNIIRRFGNWINEKYRTLDTQRLVMNAILVISLSALVILISTETLMYGEEKSGILGLFFIMLFLLIMLMLVNVYPHKIGLWSAIVTVPINFVFFPYQFLIASGGGIKSGMPIWLTFGILLVFLMTEGIYCRILAPLTIALNAGMMVWAYLNPAMSPERMMRTYYYNDNLIAMLVVGCSCGFVLKYQKIVQKRQTRVIELARLTAEQEKQNAQKANQAKSKFLTNMSHDIRTPMNAIVGMTDIAKYNIDDADKVKECLQVISASSTQLFQLLNNVLDLSEIETQGLKLKEIPFNLEELMENIDVVLWQSARNKKIDLQFHVDIKNGNLIGDHVRLRQMIMNIIGNSVKFTPIEGNITVTVKQVDNEIDDFANLVFEIEDTGIGMSQEFVNKIFNQFERDESQSVEKIEGNGIGMSITKGIADAMGATIQVQSKQGVGTKFTIYLRMKVDQNSREAIHKEKDGSISFDASGKRILIVEDNEINMEIIKGILERTNAELICAWSAEEALDIIQNEGNDFYDIIFMDIQLPGMDGYSAARNIRRLPREEAMTVPILAMTANAFSQDVEKAFDSGMNAHIAKPIDVDELFQKLYHFLYS